MRIRTIKPEFFTHEKLFDLEKETGLPMRVAFPGLWCAADREGRFKWEPRRLGIQILPYDQVDFSRVLDALESRGFIRRYRVEGEDFGVIPSFKTHQVINNREKDSELPEPLENQEFDACSTREPRDEDARKFSLSGREGKGKEGNKEGTRPGREAKPPKPDLEIPDSLPFPLRDALTDWKAHRKEIRKPLTATQWEKLVEDCRKDPSLWTAAIRKSIVSGWQGLFPEKITPGEIAAAGGSNEVPALPAWLPDDWRDIAAFVGVENAAELTSHTKVPADFRYAFETACRGRGTAR